MSFKIKFSNDVTNAEEEARGSDGRLNVSSRSDDRAYYNSRDEGLTFSVVHTMASVATDEFFSYWRNASADKTLVIRSVTVWGGEPMSFKLHLMDTVAATGGTEVVPSNMNGASAKAAPDDSVVMCMQGNATTPITGAASSRLIGRVGMVAVQEESHFDVTGDVIRLGQNNALGIEAEEVATVIDVDAMIVGYYE